jgi:asparagine synthase (glutamine-hydrolysing)
VWSAAYYAYDSAAQPLQRAAISGVLRALRTRGPDGQGEWFSDDGRVALARTCLAVIGPGLQGHQPMTNAQRPHVLSFNGAIYNHVQLRAALELRSHQFHGNSDTEVVLAMYREHGEAMLAQLRGMFAFAIWDSERAELMLARDAYGVKPLYYADDGQTVRVASQFSALRCDSAISNDPDPAGWAGFHLLGSVPEPFTTYRAISAVPTGALLRFGQHGPLAVQQWFNLAAVVDVHPPSETIAQAPVADTASKRAINAGSTAQLTFRQALLDSSRAHFVADVPIGLFLSTGLDSAVLLALACELGYRPQAITLAFDEFRGSTNDESVFAAQLAADLGVEHHVRRISAAEFNAQIPAILEAMDQPSIDGVNTWFVSKVAAELGLKVALSGIGGDELMAGYPSFRQVPWLARLGIVPARVPAWAMP